MRKSTWILTGLLALGATTGQASADAPSPHIVVFDASVSDVDAATRGRERAHGFDSGFRYRHALRGFSASLSEQQVRRLEADPAVDFVSPDSPVHAASLVPLAAGEPSPPTGVRRIGAATTTAAREASAVNVAVLDTGADLDHPDLPSVVGAKNCITPGTPAEDDNWHGTHVAGSIGAANNGAGVVGVAPGTRMYAVKVLDSTAWGTWSQIICGIDWVTATRTDSDPSNDIAVANMSIVGAGTVPGTCSSTTAALRLAICRSTARGVTYVAAAGNNAKPFDDPAAAVVPAAYPEVLAVTAISDSDGLAGAAGPTPSCSAVNADDAAATFSNYATNDAGRAHTIAGPGTCIRSTTKNGVYSTANGTSMATPHIAGAVALCLREGASAGPCAGMSPAQIVTRMRAEAESHSLSDPVFGFSGDPLHPRAGSYFGFLGWAGGVAETPPPDPEPEPEPEPPPAPAPAGIQLSAIGSKVKGLQQAALSWTGGSAGSFGIYRSGARVATRQSSDGSGTYSDAIGKKGGGSYVYEVCQLAADGGRGACSAAVTVSF